MPNRHFRTRFKDRRELLRHGYGMTWLIRTCQVRSCGGEYSAWRFGDDSGSVCDVTNFLLAFGYSICTLHLV